MTPETRAARDRLEAFIEAMADELDHRIPRRPNAELKKIAAGIRQARTDLRTVLAALDQQPTFIVETLNDITEEQLADFNQRWRERWQADSPSTQP
jgi:hypothetical protein